MQRTRKADAPHALYRFYGHDGALLYIGITCDVGARWAKHSKDKPWWTEVARTTVEHHGSREAVLAAEKSAIQAEQPKYNIQHRSGEPFKPLPATQRPRSGVLREGDVVALGLVNGECPIGMVTDLDSFGVRLDLACFTSWGAAYFDGPRVVMWDQVVDIRHAGFIDEDDLRRDGWADWAVKQAGPIHDMEPVNEFKSRYEDAHLPKFRCDQCGKWEKITRRAVLGECYTCEHEINSGRRQRKPVD